MKRRIFKAPVHEAGPPEVINSPLKKETLLRLILGLKRLESDDKKGTSTGVMRERANEFRKFVYGIPAKEIADLVRLRNRGRRIRLASEGKRAFFEEVNGEGPGVLMCVGAAVEIYDAVFETWERTGRTFLGLSETAPWSVTGREGPLDADMEKDGYNSELSPWSWMDLLSWEAIGDPDDERNSDDKETARMSGGKSVSFYREGERFAVETDVPEPDEFLRLAAERLAEIDNSGRMGNSRADYFVGWLPLIVDIACKLRGYKANVDEVRVLVAGRLSPSAEARVDPLPEPKAD